MTQVATFDPQHGAQAAGVADVAHRWAVRLPQAAPIQAAGLLSRLLLLRP